MQTQLFDANGQPIPITGDTMDDEIRELPTSNIPPPTPKPKWFDAKVNEIGGFVHGIPKYRVVWGMDESNTHFAMGKMRMKYPTLIDTYQTVKGVYLCEHGKRRKYIPAKQATEKYYDQSTDSWTRNVKKNELIIPVIEERKVEIGTPLWIMEQFVESEGFGTPEQWEAERYLINPDNSREFIDVLGAFPSKGRYIKWFDLVDVDDEGRQQYRELDEGAIEIIRAQHVFNQVRFKDMKYYDREVAVKQRDDRWNQQWAKDKEQMVREMLNIKKHKTTFG